MARSCLEVCGSKSTATWVVLVGRLACNATAYKRETVSLSPLCNEMDSSARGAGGLSKSGRPDRQLPAFQELIHLLVVSGAHRLNPGPSTQSHMGMLGKTLQVLLDVVSQLPGPAFRRSWKVLEGPEVLETAKV